MGAACAKHCAEKCRDGMKYTGLGMDFKDTAAEKRIKDIDALMEELRKERGQLKADLHGTRAPGVREGEI